MKLFFRFILLLTVAVSACKKADQGEEETTATSFLVTPTGNLGYPEDITSDNDYIYITGYTFATKGTPVNFGTTQLPSGGDSDAFLAKYDKQGKLQWAKMLGNENREYGYATAVDADGNVYIAGTFTGTTNIGGVALTIKDIKDPWYNPNVYDMFFAKYDKNGKQLWVKQLSGASTEEPGGIVIDKTGKIYLTGRMGWNLTIDNQTNGVTGNSFFVAYFNTDGSLNWTKNYGVGIQQIQPTVMKITSGNNLVIYGKYEGQRTIEGFTLSTPSGVFTTMLNSAGTVLWANGFGFDITTNANGLAVDNQENVYIGGDFKSSITIGNQTLNSDVVKTGFIASYDKTGKVRWAYKVNDDAAQTFETVMDVSCYNNKVYLTGYYGGNLPIGNVTLKAGPNYMQAFTAAFNSDGTFVQAANVGTTVGITHKLRIDNSGFAMLYGTFSNKFTLEGKEYAAQGDNSLFLAGYKLK